MGPSATNLFSESIGQTAGCVPAMGQRIPTGTQMPFTESSILLASTTVGDGDQALRQSILEAAIVEFLARGIDGFGLERVAARAGVSPSAVTRMWHDRRVLLMDAQLTIARERVAIPDTGSLRGDLEAIAAVLIKQVSTPEGRAWFQWLLPASREADFSEVRTDFWQARLDDFVPVFSRAAERNELHRDVDPRDAIRMFAGAYLYDVIFANDPVRPEYAARTLEAFIRGISR
jgi:AcrR family transcriptional regulator